jgi:arylsulfatase A-like enzyme
MLTFQRRSDQTTAAAKTWLTAVKEPFFAWVHYWDPHDLLVRPPPEVLERFLEPREATGSPSYRDAYDAEVYYVDQQLGELLSMLASDGRLDRTIVAVVADHGEGLGDHGWRGHRLLYQEHVRVPLVLHLPEQLPKHLIGAQRPLPTSIPDLVRTIDLFPTVIEALGLSPPGNIEGQSLLPLLRAESEPPRLAYADQLNLWDANARIVELRPEDDLLHCMMDQRFKLIYKPLHPERIELYDLESDPGEERNLYASDHPEAQRLLRHLLAREPFVLEGPGAVRDTRFDLAEPAEIPASALEALKVLGYIDGTTDGSADGAPHDGSGDG